MYVYIYIYIYLYIYGHIVQLVRTVWVPGAQADVLAQVDDQLRRRSRPPLTLVLVAREHALIKKRNKNMGEK